MAAAKASSKPSDAQSKHRARVASASVRANGSAAGDSAADSSEQQQQSAAGGDSKGDGAQDSQYVKELQRTVRNVNKKLSLMQKVDAIIAENPGASLDELVAQRKINPDQKAQALKKPQLQAQLVQLDEQIVQCRKFEEETHRHFAAEKEELRAAHQAELEAARASAGGDNTTTTTTATSSGDTRSKYLVLSRFLRAAAARRQTGEDETTEESQAFEGVLLMLYSGDTTAVDAMEKLVEGSDENAASTTGESVGVSYNRVKQISMSYVDDLEADDEEESAQPTAYGNGVNGHDETGTDPTTANAGLTEVQAEAPTAEPDVQQLVMSEGAAQSTVGIDAANAAGAAASATEPANTAADTLVSIPRDPSEVENKWAGADRAATANWADEVPPASVPETTATPPNDGFNEVVRTRGGRGGDGRGRGGHYRGRGGPREGGDRRGRGGRGGDARGRGGAGEGGRGRGGRGGRGRGDSAAPST